LSVDVDDLLQNDRVQVKEIMRRIRQHVAEHGSEHVDISDEIQSSNLGSDLYDELAEARRLSTCTYVTLQARHSRTPVIGRLIDWARVQLHQLVLFYVNRQAAAQIAFNAQLVLTLEQILKAVESEKRGGPKAPQT
jgi:hypothetical protein